MNAYAHITGWGTAVPEKILTNEEIAQMVETNDEWIVSRTGIKERRIASAEQSTASLAADAALQALEVAGVTPPEIDLIIVATSSPEHVFPSTASLVQDRIGASKAGAFDLSAACTGFSLTFTATAVTSSPYRRARTWTSAVSAVAGTFSTARMNGSSARSSFRRAGMPIRRPGLPMIPFQL